MILLSLKFNPLRILRREAVDVLIFFTLDFQI